MLARRATGACTKVTRGLSEGVRRLARTRCHRDDVCVTLRHHPETKSPGRNPAIMKVTDADRQAGGSARRRTRPMISTAIASDATATSSGDCDSPERS